MEKDFNKAAMDISLLPADVAAVVKRLSTFKVPVHPRVRLFYRLLRKTLAAQAHRSADSLYAVNKYNDLSRKTLHVGTVGGGGALSIAEAAASAAATAAASAAERERRGTGAVKRI